MRWPLLGTRIQFVENAKVPLGRVLRDAVQNFFAATRLRLKQAVSARRVGYVEVTMQEVIRHNCGGIVSAIPYLLRQYDVEQRSFYDGGFSGGVRTGNNKFLVKNDVVLYNAVGYGVEEVCALHRRVVVFVVRF